MQGFFWDLLGSAGGFAHRIECTANPDGTRFRDLAPIVLSAAVTDQKACERVCFLGCWLLDEPSRPSCFFCLHRLEGLHVDNGIVGILCVVLRKFAVVNDGLFGKVVRYFSIKFPSNRKLSEGGGLSVLFQMICKFAFDLVPMPLEGGTGHIHGDSRFSL